MAGKTCSHKKNLPARSRKGGALICQSRSAKEEESGQKERSELLRRENRWREPGTTPRKIKGEERRLPLCNILKRRLGPGFLSLPRKGTVFFGGITGIEVFE